MDWRCFKKNCTKTVGLLPLNMERLPTKQDGRNRTGGVQNASNDGDSWALSAATMWDGYHLKFTHGFCKRNIIYKRSLVSIYLAVSARNGDQGPQGWRAWNLNHVSNSCKHCTKDWIVEHPPSPCKANKIQLQSVTIISIYRYILSASSMIRVNIYIYM